MVSVSAFAIKKPSAPQRSTAMAIRGTADHESDLFLLATARRRRREEAELFVRATIARRQERDEAELFLPANASRRQRIEDDHRPSTSPAPVNSYRITKNQPPAEAELNDPPPPVLIRSVWAENLDTEFDLIRATVARYPYAAIDTEFPGSIHQATTKRYFKLSADERYALLKSNVDDLNLIQVGLTLSDAAGTAHFVWEFNFRDFDVDKDRHNPESIALLREHGIDFEKNREHGIDSSRFAELLQSSGLVRNESRVSWVAFSCSYDFGYLIKILTTGQKLPETMDGFMEQLGYFFGTKVFDIKYLMKKFSSSNKKLGGGLERVATELKVTRTAGVSHQAGSDSLLTSQVFQKISMLFLLDGWEHHHGVLCGLQVR